MTALRQHRADHQAAQRANDPSGEPADKEHQSAAEQPTVTVAEWRYAGSGYLYGEKYWADIAHARIQTARAIRRRATERDEQQETN